MADVRLTVQQFTRAGNGLKPTFKSDMGADTYYFANSGRTLLYVRNTGGSASVVTLVTTKTVDGLAVADRTHTVPATTGDNFLGPYPTTTYNNATGEIGFTLTNPGDTEVAVLELPLT